MSSARSRTPVLPVRRRWRPVGVFLEMLFRQRNYYAAVDLAPNQVQRVAQQAPRRDPATHEVAGEPRSGTSRVKRRRLRQ